MELLDATDSTWETYFQRHMEAASSNTAAFLVPAVDLLVSIICWGSVKACPNATHDGTPLTEVSVEETPFPSSITPKLQQRAFECLLSLLRLAPLAAPNAAYGRIRSFVQHVGVGAVGCDICGSVIWDRGRLTASTLPLLMCLLPRIVSDADTILSEIVEWAKDAPTSSKRPRTLPSSSPSSSSSSSRSRDVLHAGTRKNTTQMHVCHSLVKWLVLAPLSHGWHKMLPLVRLAVSQHILPVLQAVTVKDNATRKRKRISSEYFDETTDSYTTWTQHALAFAAIVLHTDSDWLYGVAGPECGPLLHNLQSAVPPHVFESDFFATLLGNVNALLDERIRGASVRHPVVVDAAKPARNRLESVNFSNRATLHADAMHHILDFLNPATSEASSAADVLKATVRMAAPLARVSRMWRDGVSCWNGWTRLIFNAFRVIDYPDGLSEATEDGDTTKLTVLCDCGSCRAAFQVPEVAMQVIHEKSKGIAAAATLHRQLAAKRMQVQSALSRPGKVRVCAFCQCNAAQTDTITLKTHLNKTHGVTTRKITPLLKYCP